MKAIAVALVSATLSLVSAVAAEPTIQLTGIAHLDDGDVALLEVRRSGGAAPLKAILEAGERMDGIEVVSINLKAATATLKQGNKVTEYSFGTGGDTGKTPAVNLKEADSPQVLDLYQRFSGRTIIASSSLPAARITVKSDSDPVAVVAQALADRGIVVTPHSDKFTFATRLSDVPHLAQIQQPPASQDAPKAERFAPGLIKFQDADLNPVLDIYQELTGRTLLRAQGLPSLKATVRSQTAMNRAEAIWLLESVLYLGGIAATSRFDKFAFITSLADISRLEQIKAPPPPPKDPKPEQFPPGAIKFNNADLSQALDIYQELIRRTLVKDPALPRLSINVKSQTPLTRDEAVWLLESLLQLGGVRFVADGDNQMKVISETSSKANIN